MLLLRPLPWVGESLRGYLLRLADQNGIAGIGALFRLIEKTAVEQELEAVANILGRSENDLNRLLGVVPRADGSRAGQQGGVAVPLRFWNTRYSRFCPICLAESNVWQVHWELALVVACRRHNLMLLDRCPKCCLPVLWNRSHLLECKCGQPLAEIPANACTEDESWVSARQAHLLVPIAFENPSTDHLLTALSLSELTSLLWFIGGYASGISAKPLKIPGVYQIEVATRLITAACATLSCWPKNFHWFLYELGDFRRDTHNADGLMNRFGFFYQSLYNNFNDKKFAFLHDAFEEFLKEHWPGTFARRNRRLSGDLIRDHHMLPLPRVAAELRVARKKIHQLIANGQLTASTRTTPSGRIFVSIERNSLLEFQVQKADWISFTEARAILGLSKKGFRKLLDAGVLNAIAGPQIDGSPVWTFSKTLIEATLAKPEALVLAR